MVGVPGMPEIGETSRKFRQLGIGYANLGALLMAEGLPYDSDEGRALCGALTAIMTGVSYATSAEIAGELGPFPGYKDNKANPEPEQGWSPERCKMLARDCLAALLEFLDTAEG